MNTNYPWFSRVFDENHKPYPALPNASFNPLFRVTYTITTKATTVETKVTRVIGFVADAQSYNKWKRMGSIASGSQTDSSVAILASRTGGPVLACLS